MLIFTVYLVFMLIFYIKLQESTAEARINGNIDNQFGLFVYGEKTKSQFPVAFEDNNENTIAL